MNAERRRLVLALLFSLLIHALLLSLTFSGQGLGLPGFGFPWQERRIEAPELRVLLVPSHDATAGPPAPSVARSLPQASIDRPAADRPGQTLSIAPAPPPSRTGPPATPHARLIAPTTSTKPATEALSQGKAPPAATPIVARHGAGNGEAAQAPVPAPDVVAAKRPEDAELSLPMAPSEPVPVIVAAPSASNPDVAANAPRNADSVVQESVDPQTRVRAVELPSAERSDQDVLLQPAQQERARQESGRRAAEREAAVQEATRQKAAREDAERRDAAQRITQQQEAARQEAIRLKAEQAESTRLETERQEDARLAAQQEAARQAAALQEAERAASARLEAERQHAARLAAAQQEAARQAAVRQEAERVESARREAERQHAARLAAAQQEVARQATARQEAERVESARLEAERQHAAQLAAARLEAEQAEAKREARLRAIGRQLDEEAARRDAASAAASPASKSLPASSNVRRGRLFGRTDPNTELIRYAEAWARKIELNMTIDMVREAVKRPYTNPLVTVAIRSDGSVESVTFVMSSGVADLDEAIRRIVQSQVPYQTFPPALAREYDVIEIRRTWHFDVAVRLY
jgi:hypothetical protein